MVSEALFPFEDEPDVLFPPEVLLLLPDVPLLFVDEPDVLFPPEVLLLFVDVLLLEANCDEVVDFLVTFELFDTTFFPKTVISSVRCFLRLLYHLNS